MSDTTLIETMKNIDFYPHHPMDVEFIETHISYVFLAGDFVYKVKKPVRFDFLDFTSLEKRKFYCEEELRLNRRLAPDIYLDVIGISKDVHGNLTLGKGIEVIEYAVSMKKLPENRMLKTLLGKGMVDKKIMDDLAKKIAAFHQEAQTGGHIDKMGDIEHIRRNQEENFIETLKYINRTIPDYQYHFIRDYTYNFLNKNKELFDKRISDHKIRDCHGDLHLDHVCVDDQIIIYDCIEFNERFRYGDVAEDVAFLTMDIDFNGYSQHTESFIESYIKHSGDVDLPSLLNFYRCYYAYVRGKVTSFRLVQEELPRSERENIFMTAAQYFDLAYQYAARLDRPVLILTAGLMGSGKSYQARKLAAYLGADIISTDLLRKDIFNMNPTERRFDDFGRGLYSDDISRLIYDKVYNLAAQKIKQGKAVIIDASFKKMSERKKAMTMAQILGIRVYVLECVCPDEIARKRLEKRVQDNDNVSDGRWELFQRQKSDFDKVTEVPADSYLKIDTSADPEMTRQKIIRKIKLED